MGAIVLNTAPDSATWEKVKPKDFPGKDLSAALKAYDGVRKTAFAMIDRVPKLSVKEIQDAITTLNGTIKDMEAMSEGLKKVQAAAKKTASELEKLGKDKKDDDKKAWQKARDVASGMEVAAENLIKQLK
ncbi:MAG TPA: hypothetical protein VLA78_01650 [Paracoccaceae bacterium]|jgi:hypothetical protein|nr:hypothetical protein [Paracoccaceae bacterium]